MVCAILNVAYNPLDVLGHIAAAILVLLVVFHLFYLFYFLLAYNGIHIITRFREIYTNYENEKE